MENIKKLEELTNTLIRVEENLKEEYKILEFLLEYSLDGYWDWKMSSDYEYLSPKFKQQLGYTDDEMENKPESWQKICNQDDLITVYNIVGKCINGEHDEFNQMLRFTHKNGNEIQILCRGIVVSRDENGIAERMVGTHRIII